MKLKITRQDSYSRGELILRTLFGAFYIAFPHGFLMMFVGIWSMILGFFAFWVVLFTGKYPKSWFDFQVNYISWSLRVNASIYNLIDGYPEFGVNGKSDKVSLNVSYPESVNRGLVLLRMFFGFFYVALPHMFCLLFIGLWAMILMFFAWWVVLFTGNYPETWHDFQVGILRWSTRVNLYLGYLSDEYPPFSTKE